MNNTKTKQIIAASALCSDCGHSKAEHWSIKGCMWVQEPDQTCPCEAFNTHSATPAAALNAHATLTEQLAEAKGKVERFEAMLEKAVYIEFDQWAIYNNYPFAKKPGDGKIRLFKKNETNQSFDVREFDSVLEAYEARETFEATQNVSDGGEIQETEAV